MFDIFNRSLLFITNITGCTSGKYSWKSYPVQRNSLTTDLEMSDYKILVLYFMKKEVGYV